MSNPNKGALFRNTRKERDTQPDYTGVLEIDGKERRLVGWVKTSKAGRKYLSLALDDEAPAKARRTAA